MLALLQNIAKTMFVLCTFYEEQVERKGNHIGEEKLPFNRQEPQSRPQPNVDGPLPRRHHSGAIALPHGLILNCKNGAMKISGVRIQSKFTSVSSNTL